MDSALTEFIETKEHRALKQSLAKHKPIIDDFFQRVHNLVFDQDKVLFELVFCLCTPQSKAVLCRDAVVSMETNDLLRSSTKAQLLDHMQNVRFNDRKSDYIISAQGEFEHIYANILRLKEDPQQLREWLANNVKGFGFKESSHFLRNIGIGENLAILDVHIIRALHEFGLTTKTNSGLSKKDYLETEQRFASLAKALNMSVIELDCTIWLSRSGSGEIM